MKSSSSEQTIKTVVFGILFFMLAGVAINYLVFQMQIKSRASGESVTLQFANAANGTHTTVQVKPSTTLSIRGYAFQIVFDKSVITVKDIAYKMGVVSPGLGDDNAQLGKVNQSGVIKIQGELQTAGGGVLQPSALSDLVVITLDTKSTMPQVSIPATSVTFYALNTDSTLLAVPASNTAQIGTPGATAGATGTTQPSSTPTPVSNGPFLTPKALFYCLPSTKTCTATTSQYNTLDTCQSNIKEFLKDKTTGVCYASQADCDSVCKTVTLLPTPTLAPQAMYYCDPAAKKCSATTAIYGNITTCQNNLNEFLKGKTTGICYTKQADCDTTCSGATGSQVAVTLNLKLKFQGVTKQPVAGASPISVRLKVGNSIGAATDYKTVAFTADASGIWTGSADFTGVSTTGNTIYVKGPKHNQKKLCDSSPTEATPGSYSCSTGKIALQAGANTLDFTGVYQLVGDLPTQDGIVNSVDLALIRNNLGKSDPATLVFCDLNLDGSCDTQDYSAIISALSIRSDEQ